MPIPDFNVSGLLPVGVHDCTMAEVQARLGTFQSSDQRPALFSRLEALVQAMQASGLFETVLIDGSFVTAKTTPNDIDLVAVLRPGHNFERDLPMSEYTLVSRSLLRRRFGFDVIVAERESQLYRTYVEFFSRLREDPEARKGLLQVRL